MPQSYIAASYAQYNLLLFIGPPNELAESKFQSGFLSLDPPQGCPCLHGVCVKVGIRMLSVCVYAKQMGITVFPRSDAMAANMLPFNSYYLGWQQFISLKSA